MLIQVIRDITMASIVRDKVDPEMSIEDIEEAMAEIAIERNIKDVGQLPLSEQVELQLDKKQRFLKIYQYCKPTTAMTMVDHSDAFSLAHNQSLHSFSLAHNQSLNALSLTHNQEFEYGLLGP
jgi:hypothetical protein